jgi:hypothetical protein
MTYTWKSPRYAKRQAERDAVRKARKVEPYLERQARREAVPPLKRQARAVVSYLERQAARAAERNVDKQDD